MQIVHRAIDIKIYICHLFSSIQIFDKKIKNDDFDFVQNIK